MARDPVLPATLSNPQISLIGQINEDRARDFLNQLAEAETKPGDIALELTTLGGDAEIARRIVLEIEAARDRRGGRILFIGKTIVYSAGTTIMSAFPREDRYLSTDAMVMIHCRQLEKSIEISGPMRASLPKIEAVVAQVKTGIEVEKENFLRLIAGSDISLEELLDRALHNWYLTAAEAVRRGLVAGIWTQAGARRAADAPSG